MLCLLNRNSSYVALSFKMYDRMRIHAPKIDEGNRFMNINGGLN